jgi:hypothetical protein
MRDVPEPAGIAAVEPRGGDMQLRLLFLITALALGQAAAAADSTERTAPYDRNPACMDRTADASTGNCVVQDEGTPRHTYPPKQSATTATPAPASTSTAVPTTVRRAPAASK